MAKSVQRQGINQPEPNDIAAREGKSGFAEDRADPTASDAGQPVGDQPEPADMADHAHHTHAADRDQSDRPDVPAHQQGIPPPAAQNGAICGNCHEPAIAVYADSLHCDHCGYDWPRD